MSLLAPIVFVGLFEYPVLLGLFFIAFYDRQPQAIIAIWPKSSWVFGGARILLIGILAFFTIKGAWVSARDHVITDIEIFMGSIGLLIPP